MQKITADLSELPNPFSDGMPAQRVETGALQINSDWPGVYIRGDRSAYYAAQLSKVLDQLEQGTELIDIIAVSSLNSLVNTLGSCTISHDHEQGELDLDVDVGC